MEQVILPFIEDKPAFFYVRIDEGRDSPLQGKARILEFLAQKATGEYFFFTDADMQLPNQWVRGMLAGFNQPEIGVVVGMSVVKNKGIFSALQGLEWLSVLSVMHVLGKWKVPSTGMGNNMAVTRKAWMSVGGYTQIGFSIVEDYALYKAILEKEFGFNHLFSQDILAFTEPPNNFFKQRKRWLQGALSTKTLLLIPASLQILLFPILLFLGFFFPKEISQFAIGYFLFHTFLISLEVSLLRLWGYLPFVVLFPFYLCISWFLQGINLLLPTKVEWKDRIYS
jgi:cellulose synthase/poly-beta-1,6-N-acetylglucosamine synthase-like glycosyltransferase